jgi:hypothetical protein
MEQFQFQTYIEQHQKGNAKLKQNSAFPCCVVKMPQKIMSES